MNSLEQQNAAVAREQALVALRPIGAFLGDALTSSLANFIFPDPKPMQIRRLPRPRKPHDWYLIGLGNSIKMVKEDEKHPLLNIILDAFL